MFIWRVLAVLFAGGYGLLVAFAGWSQVRVSKIPRWSAISMLVVGAFIVCSAGFLVTRSLAAIYMLILGLLAVHGLTVINGFALHGRLNPTHHLIRLAVSLLIVLLAILSVRHPL